MAKYKYNPYRSSEGREAINQNCLDNMTGKVSNLGWSAERIQEAIFNRYTGIGGLSGVQFGDHANFAEYTRAKQEIEIGQFFTPPNVIFEMLQSLTVRPEDKVIDPTCGMGNFFNFMPEEYNCYGVELDVQAYNVCRFLYPKANILDGSMLDKPFKKASFDVALCNPPFNLKWTYNKEINSSQNVFLWKLAEWLKPGAVVVFICPFHWLEDAFFFKSTIERIAGLYSYIGGYKLPDDTFKRYGVDKYETKVLYFQRLGTGVKSQPYTGVTGIEQALRSVAAANGWRIAQQATANRDIWRTTAQERSAGFEYKIKKYLYEMATHKQFAQYAPSCIDYLKEFLEQVKPSYMASDQWEKQKTTEKNVVDFFKKAFKKSIHGEKKKPSQMSQKTIRRKRRGYALAKKPFEQFEQDDQAAAWIGAYEFIGGKGTTCQFTPKQAHDLNLMLNKSGILLNWEMGAGKTAVSLAWATWQMMHGKAYQTVVVSTTLSIESTWSDHLTRNGIPFRIIKNERDIRPDVPVLLLSFDGMKRQRRVTLKSYKVVGIKGQKPRKEEVKTTVTGTKKLYKYMARYVRQMGKRLVCIVDESHEMKNHTSQRNRMTFAALRLCRFKLCATGTATLNNIAELYPQLQFIYNNSHALTNDCEWMFEQDAKTGHIRRWRNWEKKGGRFDFWHGFNDFRRCFNPAKATVMGVEKQNQDVYNPEQLKAIIDQAILTRTFAEISAEISDKPKYFFHAHLVTPNESEAAIYDELYQGMEAILREFYASTGNARKDASRRRLQQMQLLFKACCNPHLFQGYRKTGKWLGSKRTEIVEFCQKHTEPILLGCLTLELRNIRPH